MKGPILNWRYALGEIIIVILSITIAFALNNWASARKDRVKARQYLENLQKDLEADITTLETLDAKLDTSLRHHWQITQHFFRPLPGRDTVGFLFFGELKQRFDFYPHNATFESLRYSGDFQLIKDIALKNQIVEHYNQYELVDKANRVYEVAQADYTYRYFYENHDFSKMSKTAGLDFLDDPKFRNLVFSNIGILGRLQSTIRSTINRCKALMERIEKQ